ncbi:hypothetical protein EDB19DRAFT_2042172 [Suillus lakei]|nr:hypothetical protein EDB19DRAFT_2042172 [Suillus lakei]
MPDPDRTQCWTCSPHTSSGHITHGGVAYVLVVSVRKFLTASNDGIVLIQESQGKNPTYRLLLDKFSQFIHKVVVRQAHHRMFLGVHQQNAVLQVFTFAHVPCDSFLCILPGTPSFTPDGRTLSLS